MTYNEIHVEVVGIDAEMRADHYLLSKPHTPELGSIIIERSARRSDRRTELMLARLDNILNEISWIGGKNV